MSFLIPNNHITINNNNNNNNYITLTHWAIYGGRYFNLSSCLSQGEVEQIALMKPKALSEHDDGMLEFLEDIIGTSFYKEPIEELSHRVEELGEERSDKVSETDL